MAFRVRQSGGFWNGVDGVITGYAFTTRAPKAGGGLGEQTEWVSLVPEIRIDGKSAPETQHMKLGGTNEWTISENGQVATAADGNNDPRWVAGDFLGSLAQAADAAGVDAQLPDTEAGEALDLRGIIGLRVRLEQQKDEKATQKLGKRKSAKGKGEYDRTNTIVSKVYGRVETAQGKSVGKQAANTAGKSTARAAAASGNGFDVDGAARDIVLGLLADAPGNTLTKNKLRVPVIKQTAEDVKYADHREDIRARCANDAFLSQIDGITFDKASGTLSLAQ